MTGFRTLKMIRKFEQEVDELGLCIREARNYEEYGGQDGIVLTPRDDRLPHYSRDAIIFSGTIEEAILWVHGVRWARDYDYITKTSTAKKREEQEQKELNRQLMRTLKTGVRAEGTVKYESGMSVETEYDEEVPF